MKSVELITVFALLAGPIFAVLIQLSSERRKQRRDFQSQTLRMLVNVRHLPADASYSTAINMVPIDFNAVPTVMAAHKNYIEAIRLYPSAENAEAHLKNAVSKQTKLIFEIAKYLSYDLPETDIQTSAYAASGFIERDNLMLAAWRAWPRIASALEGQIEPLAPTSEQL